jgi:peroxiredoxin
MPFLRRIIAWGAVAFAVGVVIVFALPSYRLGEASIAGKKADDFALQVSGKAVHLSDLRDKVVVLNFWASWCPPCVEEAPALNRLEKYIAPKGGMILGVSVDEDPDAYAKFLRDQGVNFPTWRDPSVQGNKWKIANEYGTTMIPETYIIGRDGKIERKIIGPQQWDSPEMLRYFDAILKK